MILRININQGVESQLLRNEQWKDNVNDKQHLIIDIGLICCSSVFVSVILKRIVH